MTSNIDTTRKIGAGARLTESAVPAILATLPETFDSKARGAVADAVHSWACGDAERPAVRTGKAGEQVTTDYGRGHETLVKAVKRALSDSSDKPVAMRVTLSGEGGGSATIPADHPFYAELVALITGGEQVDAAA